MKKYILFGYDQYYPSGALNDVIDSFDSIDEAKVVVEKNQYDFYNLIDRDTWKDVDID
jgi:erythromycin esterase-like protein